MSRDTLLGRKLNLEGRMLTAKETLLSLLSRIQEIEDDVKTPINEKVSQIKKIREEISKVGTEIDSIKKEIRLLNTYNVN